MTKVKEPISLNELAKELGLSKSALTYYTSMGLLEPVMLVSKMRVFEKKDALRIIKKIQEGKKSGLSLKEIKSSLNETNNKRKN